MYDKDLTSNRGRMRKQWDTEYIGLTKMFVIKENIELGIFEKQILIRLLYVKN
jgi:hypothetical protein